MLIIILWVNCCCFDIIGSIAAELIFNIVDASKEFLRLTNFKGEFPTRSETEIAKNYLTKYFE